MSRTSLATIKNLINSQQKHSSQKLLDYLALLSTPKPLSEESFKDGISHFVKLANLSPDERTTFYGSQFYGLHYMRGFAKLWNDAKFEHTEETEFGGLCPAGWEYRAEQDFLVLGYQGDDLSGALDKLLLESTVIDCGMFCQLSIWFGIRYMLGNDAFNILFGRTPFYITQLLYALIPTPEEPYLGNPLFPFFDKTNSVSNSGVSISHIKNHKLYQLRHPTPYQAQNCVVINGRHTIFDPTSEKKLDLTKEEVQQSLLAHFITGFELEDNKDMNALLLELESDAQELTLTFNFTRFCTWVKTMQAVTVNASHYKPLTLERSRIPQELATRIPYENRGSMLFYKFKLDTPLQKELYSISIKFCEDVMNKQSACVILTGQAGIGKTASAACCANELSSRGKHVVWTSEILARQGEIERYRSDIQQLLTPNIDVVILDDDNLSTYAGHIIWEEIYRWYISNPHKGLFITSNEPISLANCYGMDFFDKKYHFPPFCNYTSAQYTNTIKLDGLSGQLMRQSAAATFKLADLSDDDKALTLSQQKIDQSAGIIISHYESYAYLFPADQVEFVPAIDGKILDSIVRSLKETRRMGPTYDALDPIRKKWISRLEQSEIHLDNGTIPAHSSCYVKSFQSTTRTIIAIEIISDGDKINAMCVAQVKNVVNFAHDNGGIKVILINSTELDHAAMLQEIVNSLKERERERTVSRINSLLGTALSHIIAPTKPVAPMKPVYPKQEERSEHIFSIINNIANMIPSTVTTSFRPTPNPQSFFADEALHYLQDMTHSSIHVPTKASRKKQATTNQEEARENTSSGLTSSGIFSKTFIIEYRNTTPELREAYDNQYGLVEWKYRA